MDEPATVGDRGRPGVHLTAAANWPRAVGSSCPRGVEQSAVMSRWRAEEFHPDLRGASRVLPKAVVSRRTLPLVRRLVTLSGHRRPDGVTIERVSPTCTVRLHRPPAGRPNGGALLWIHGGGLVMGSAQQDDDFCRRLADELNVTVAAVEHRLAPEHPYPAPLDDCCDALRWLCEHPGVDRQRVAVGGNSAGGGLAAALALRAHEEGFVQLLFQLLVYPMLDDRTAARPDAEASSRRVWSNTANAFGWSSYLRSVDRDAPVPSLAAPARYPDLAGAPPTWIGVGTVDLFHDEDVAYSERLTAAGVPCELLVVPGAFTVSTRWPRRRPCRGRSATPRSLRYGPRSPGRADGTLDRPALRLRWSASRPGRWRRVRRSSASHPAQRSRQGAPRSSRRHRRRSSR